MTIYSPLLEFLGAQEAVRLNLDFEAIEKIIGRSLPDSAFKHQAWWANDPSHTQSRSWIAAGWKTENLNLRGRTVTFARVSKQPTRLTVARSSDPWGALAGTVTIHDEQALTQPTGELWDAER